MRRLFLFLAMATLLATAVVPAVAEEPLSPVNPLAAMLGEAPVESAAVGAAVMLENLEAPPCFVTKWGSYGNGEGQFAYPYGAGVDGYGNVYVTGADNNRVQKFTGDGVFVTEWGSQGSGDGQFNWLDGVAVDGDGYVYVNDTGANRVQKFTGDGVFVTKWGSYGRGNGQFNYPYGVAVDGDGYVYIADTYNHRVQKFTSEGTFVTLWGWITFPQRFNYPSGVAVDGDGYVYVVDNYRVQKFTGDGVFVTKWGSYGTGDGQFTNASKVAVDGDGNVYVVDSFNHRVQKFGACGPVTLIGNLISEVEALNLQNGISNSLDAKLANAVKALDDVNENNDAGAVGKLEAFINEVEAQSGNGVSVEDADSLIAATRRIIALLIG